MEKRKQYLEDRANRITNNSNNNNSSSNSIMVISPCLDREMMLDIIAGLLLKRLQLRWQIPQVARVRFSFADKFYFILFLRPYIAI